MMTALPVWPGGLHSMAWFTYDAASNPTTVTGTGSDTSGMHTPPTRHIRQRNWYVPGVIGARTMNEVSTSSSGRTPPSIVGSGTVVIPHVGFGFTSRSSYCPVVHVM